MPSFGLQTYGPTGLPLESVMGPHAGDVDGQSELACWQRHCWPVNDPGAKHAPWPFGSVLLTGIVQQPFALGQTGMTPLMFPSADAEHVCAQTMFPVPSLTQAEPEPHCDAQPPPLLDPLPPLLDPLLPPDPPLLPEEPPLLEPDPPLLPDEFPPLEPELELPPPVEDEDEHAPSTVTAPMATMATSKLAILMVSLSTHTQDGRPQPDMEHLFRPSAKGRRSGGWTTRGRLRRSVSGSSSYAANGA